MASPSKPPNLQTICADSILNKLGEKPDLIQVLVGNRAMHRLEKTIRKELKKEIRREERKRALEHFKTELEVLIPSLIIDVIEHERSANAFVPLFELYRNSCSTTVELAYSVAIKAVRAMQSELFFP
jgi:hypothetical protein